MKNVSIKLRPVAPEDYGSLEAIHRAAFSTSEFGYNGEGDLARQLHEEGYALVSLIAEADGEPIGHVLFSRMQVVADGKRVIAAALAPLGVVPGAQHKGVGALLVKSALAALKPQGVQMAFVVGSPDYYSRFGFTTENSEPFESPYTGHYVMAMQLDSSLKQPTSGKADFAPVFARF